MVNVVGRGSSSMDRSLSLLSAVDVLYASVLSRYSINASVLIRELLLSAARFYN